MAASHLKDDKRQSRELWTTPPPTSSRAVALLTENSE